MGADDLNPTTVQTPNHPAHSESLHQLHIHCPGPKTVVSYDDINWKANALVSEMYILISYNHSSIQILMTHLSKTYDITVENYWCSAKYKEWSYTATPPYTFMVSIGI